MTIRILVVLMCCLFLPLVYAVDEPKCSWQEGVTEWIKTGTCSCVSWYTKKTVFSDNESQYICEKCDIEKCNCGVKFNTNIPFIGRCMVYGETNTTNDPSGDESTIVVNPLNAFPVLMWWLVKILMTVIILLSFGTLIAAGVMMTVPGQYDTGKDLIWKVVYTIALLGVSGTILYLVNPNFFF